MLKRSHVDKTILLLKIDNRYVPIVESAVKIIDPEADEVNNDTGNGNKENGNKEAVSLPPNLSFDSLDPLKVSSNNSGPQSLNTQVKEEQPQAETQTQAETETTEENHAL